jgi:hypothetical protein
MGQQPGEPREVGWVKEGWLSALSPFYRRNNRPRGLSESGFNVDLGTF